MALDGRSSPWSGLGEVVQLGMTLVISTVIGLGGGYALDRWLGTIPWLTLVGLGFGIAAGFLNIVRVVRALERKLPDE